MMTATTETHKSRMQNQHQKEIWELLDEYADIRDELEDTLNSFRYLKADIEFALEDITDELKLLQEHLNTYSARLMRFRLPRTRQYEVIKEHEELPFSQTE